MEQLFKCNNCDREDTAENLRVFYEKGNRQVDTILMGNRDGGVFSRIRVPLEMLLCRDCVILWHEWDRRWVGARSRGRGEPAPGSNTLIYPGGA